MAGGPSEAVGPVVVRRRLGARLRSLREDAGLRLDQAAAELEVSAAKISRLETGQSVAKTWDVRNLLTVYGLTDAAARDEVLGWVESSKATGWWHPYADTVPANLDYYISLEAEAASVSVHAVIVPALLQTREYARALLGNLFADVDDMRPEEIEALVEVRMRRQSALSRPNPLHFAAVMDESALMRQVGGSAVLRGQLQSLLEVSPGVQFRVRPLTAPVRQYTLGSFAVFEPRLPAIDHAVVNIEAAGREYFLEDTVDVEPYARAFRTLWNESLNEEDSLDLIRTRLV